MGNNASNVTAGKPKIGGAIFSAPLGTAVPTSVNDELTGFTCVGYISEDGVSNDNSPSSTDVKEWGGSTVLPIQNDRPDTFKWTMLETMEVTVKKLIYGEDNVSVDEETGEIKTKASSEELEAHAYVIDMALRDGAKQRLVIPEGKITQLDTIKYANNSAVGYGVTVSAIPDEDGYTHYDYTLKSEEISG